MLKPADLDRISRDFLQDRARDGSAAASRDRLKRVANLAAELDDAMGDLLPVDLAQVGRSKKGLARTATAIRDLGDTTDTAVGALNRGLARGGRRSVAAALGDLVPRARMLNAVREALAKDLPSPRACEVLDGAGEVLQACGESYTGLEDVYRRMPRNQ